MYRDVLPLFTLLTGFALGVFYGTTFTLWRMKEQRKYKRRRYANRGAHYVATPPTTDEEIERRGDEWAQQLIDEMSDRSADA